MNDQEKIQVLKDYEARCNGTDNFHQYNTILNAAQITDGVKLMADTFKCYWLIDTILSYQTPEFKRKNPPIEYPIQYWTIKAKEDSTAIVYMEYHEGITVIEQNFNFTDFPVMEKTIKYDAYSRMLCLLAED